MRCLSYDAGVINSYESYLRRVFEIPNNFDVLRWNHCNQSFVVFAPYFSNLLYSHCCWKNLGKSFDAASVNCFDDGDRFLLSLISLYDYYLMFLRMMSDLLEYVLELILAYLNYQILYLNSYYEHCAFSFSFQIHYGELNQNDQLLKE